MNKMFSCLRKIQIFCLPFLLHFSYITDRYLAKSTIYFHILKNGWNIFLRQGKMLMSFFEQMSISLLFFDLVALWSCGSFNIDWVGCTILDFSCQHFIQNATSHWLKKKTSLTSCCHLTVSVCKSAEGLLADTDDMLMLLCIPTLNYY